MIHNRHAIRDLVVALVLSLAISGPVLAQAGAGACADTSALQTIALGETRRLSWYPLLSEGRELDSLPPLASAAVADTAIVIVTDTTICRQALTHVLALDTTLSLTKISVMRYGGSRYIVTDMTSTDHYLKSRVFDLSWALKQTILQ